MSEYFTIFIDEHRDIPKDRLVDVFRAYPVELRWDVFTALMVRDKFPHPQDSPHRSLIADLTFDINQSYDYLFRIFGEHLYGVEKPKEIDEFEALPQFCNFARIEIKFDNLLIKDKASNNYIAWCNRKVAIAYHLKTPKSFEV